MADCCGGKNAGKPISWPRYLAGVGVFFAYHGSVAAALHVAAVPKPSLRKVRDFHRQLFLDEAREVVRRDDMAVQGLRTPQQPEEDADDGACEVTPLVREHSARS